MEFLPSIKAHVPDYAKDIRLNLRNCGMLAALRQWITLLRSVLLLKEIVFLRAQQG
ncbi:hypothetical protein P3T22_000822 [Paraburkholderia sp. GAS348]|nr:hypothetical protein [Paraburkholderia phytofirmans]